MCVLSRQNLKVRLFQITSIDDRNKFLAMMPEHVKLVKMKTPYTQCETLDREHTIVNELE